MWLPQPHQVDFSVRGCEMGCLSVGNEDEEGEEEGVKWTIGGAGWAGRLTAVGTFFFHTHCRSFFPFCLLLCF